jgi:hypothetical protein
VSAELPTPSLAEILKTFGGTSGFAPVSVDFGIERIWVSNPTTRYVIQIAIYWIIILFLPVKDIWLTEIMSIKPLNVGLAVVGRDPCTLVTLSAYFHSRVLPDARAGHREIGHIREIISRCKNLVRFTGSLIHIV